MAKSVVASKAKIGGGQPRDPGPYVMPFKLWLPKLSLTLAWEISQPAPLTCEDLRSFSSTGTLLF
jgi:hypothetical protein